MIGARASWRGVCVALMFTFTLPGMVSAAHASNTPRGLAIARANACMGCHAVDRKRVGPSFHQIAAKYKGIPQAPAILANKVRNGGSGVWGVIPMPSHPSMTDADIRTVVAWVLAGAPMK